MPTPLNPQEIYLLERYSSLEYYEEMYKAWREMLAHVEDCYDKFMHHLPHDYRKRALPYQPDSAWGQTVLPNFRNTMLSLENGYLKMKRGDASGISASIGVENDMRGVRDYWDGWMNEVIPTALATYGETSSRASHYASNMYHTYNASWNPTSLTTNYWDRGRGPLNPPPSWPIYRLNPSVTVKTDDPVPQTGIYLPTADDSAAQFLVKGEEAVNAKIGYDTKRLQYISKAPTLWTLVERIADSGGGSTTDATEETRRPNVPAGSPCPETGWWFTPAQSGSRRYFKAGDNMPSVGGDYGLTFWQWSPDQSAPKL